MMYQSRGAAPFQVVGIAGSLRPGSYNLALLRAVQEISPEELQIRIHDLSEIPFFSEDVERTAIPGAVTRLREAVADADGFLVATPEYNHGVPGVMKNAFDWLSRPPGKSVLDGKPSAIFGASPGITGTARAQSQLRQSFVFTNTPVLLQPEVLVGRAHEKFDSDGRLTDTATRKYLAQFLEAFAAWIAIRRAPRSGGSLVTRVDYEGGPATFAAKEA
jgi:chromate reductase, NAD(P)H dehydrogenase (quinone)